MDGRLETYLRPGRAFAAWPTNDDCTVVIGGWPFAEFERNRTDPERHYLAMLGLAPSFAERLAGARRLGRVVGAAVPNFYRRPYGPGWALVGDAGYQKDFITAQGMQDAFRDAELCAGALTAAFGGHRFEEVMANYQATRDAAVAGIYNLTTELATLQPPPPEMEQLLLRSTAARPGWICSPGSTPAPVRPRNSSARRSDRRAVHSRCRAIRFRNP